MALVLPYPNKPANGDTLDATVVQANITAIAQAIQSFDGSQVQAASIQAAAMAAAANPITRGAENFSNYVYSGAIAAAVSGLTITISGGVLYINGNRLVFAGVGSQVLLASKDYYIDVDNLGNVTYANVANGAAAPALTANSVRIAKVVTGGAAVGTITLSGFDSLVNPIRPINPISMATVQNPYQFMVRMNGISQPTVANTPITVQFNDKTSNGAFDTNGNFSLSTFKYTVPVSGKYLISAYIRLDVTTSGNLAQITLVTAASTYVLSSQQPNGGSAQTKGGAAIMVNLTAGDQIFVQGGSYGSAGTIFNGEFSGVFLGF